MPPFLFVSTSESNLNPVKISITTPAPTWICAHVSSTSHQKLRPHLGLLRHHTFPCFSQYISPHTFIEVRQCPVNLPLSKSTENGPTLGCVALVTNNLVNLRCTNCRHNASYSDIITKEAREMGDLDNRKKITTRHGAYGKGLD